MTETILHSVSASHYYGYILSLVHKLPSPSDTEAPCISRKPPSLSVELVIYRQSIFFHPMPVGQTQVLSNACLRGQWEGSAVSCSIFPLALRSPSTASGWAPRETPEARKEWGFGVQNAWNARLEGDNFFTGQFVPSALEIEGPFAKSTVGSSSDPRHCQSKNILKGMGYGWWLPADADLRVQPALFFPDSISKCCWTT